MICQNIYQIKCKKSVSNQLLDLTIQIILNIKVGQRLDNHRVKSLFSYSTHKNMTSNRRNVHKRHMLLQLLKNLNLQL
jgi:hypothetical protein